MAKRIGSTQRKTRYKYTQHYRQRGKLSLGRFFQEFAEGDKVNLITNPMVQEGRFFRRFHGMTGTISGKRGFCYRVEIQDGHKDKPAFVIPIHLKKENHL